jgi:acyl carrier protein
VPVGEERERIEGSLMRFIDRLLDEKPTEGADPLAIDAVDSLGLEQLVKYVEAEFEVTIRNEEMVRRNFGSVSTLAALIESKRDTGSTRR